MSADRFARLRELPPSEAWAALARLLVDRPVQDEAEREGLENLVAHWPVVVRRARLDTGPPPRVERGHEWPRALDAHVSRELGLVRTLVASPVSIVALPEDGGWSRFCLPRIQRWEPTRLGTSTQVQRAWNRLPDLADIDLVEMINPAGVWGGGDPTGFVRAIGAHAAGRLRRLGLSTAPLVERHTDALARAPAARGLCELDITACHLGRAAANLAHWPAGAELRTLSAGWNGVGPEILAAWAHSQFLSAIEALELPGNTMLVAGVEHLVAGTLPRRLRRLDLSECSLLDEGVETLCRAGPYPVLRDLALAGNVLGDPSVESLCRSGLLDSLHRLDLRRNRLSTDALARVEHAWSRATPLHVLVDGDPVTLEMLRRRPFARPASTGR